MGGVDIRLVKRRAEYPPCPQPQLVIHKNHQQRARDRFRLGALANRVLGLCPGAEYGPAKRWPSKYFAAVAQHQISQGWEVWIFGSSKDVEIARDINNTTGNACRDFSGKTTLADAVDLLSLTDCVVSNDSGLMHVAASLDRKLIAVYGSSDPDFTPPLNSTSRVISLNLECSPCFKRECPLGHYKCLLDLSPQRVLAELEGL